MAVNLVSQPLHGGWEERSGCIQVAFSKVTDSGRGNCEFRNGLVSCPQRRP